MNKIIITIVFIFWAVVSIFFARSLINNDQQTNGPTGLLPSDASLPIGTNLPILTTVTVGLHNTEADCWVTAGNTIYSVTSYLAKHPGGKARIIPYCGKDIEQAFSARGHSNNARNILAGFEIGQLGESMSTINVNRARNTGGQNITPDSPNTSEDDENEYEDD